WAAEIAGSTVQRAQYLAVGSSCSHLCSGPACRTIAHGHLAIFPPFIAAISYANRTAGTKQGSSDPVVGSAPWWLRLLAGVSVVYALANFVLFIILMEGGAPSERDGKYVLHTH